MQFQVEGGEPPLQPDDQLETVDSIRRGDNVWFDRIASGRVVMRVVADAEVSGFPHPIWRIDRGTDPGVVKLVLVSSVKPFRH